ncbi:hypothetical protein SAMN05444682_103114 [Parapedobacter indicus]|uniref:Uncharacterized protein n=1 Tax=Parapedobacter indicus TaxID=1477437 RepID=A0A1I3GV03_9SPHI|nr:hypothetical protein CLV26_103115 [Parapedobacter indicus]SFI27162.1 hypothetical protein SAMN05444682_103114 [Parapedobacter indicus]
MILFSMSPWRTPIRGNTHWRIHTDFYFYSRNIKQSLAGRVAYLQVLPFGQFRRLSQKMFMLNSSK